MHAFFEKRSQRRIWVLNIIYYHKIDNTHTDWYPLASTIFYVTIIMCSDNGVIESWICASIIKIDDTRTY